MVNKQFISFLDKLKTPRNAALVESVKKGYVLCEMGPVTPTQDAMGVEVDETEFMPAKEYDEFGFDAEGEPMGVDEMMEHHPDAYNEYGYEDFNSVDGVMEDAEDGFDSGDGIMEDAEKTSETQSEGATEFNCMDTNPVTIYYGNGRVMELSGGYQSSYGNWPARSVGVHRTLSKIEGSKSLASLAGTECVIQSSLEVGKPFSMMFEINDEWKAWNSNAPVTKIVIQ